MSGQKSTFRVSNIGHSVRVIGGLHGLIHGVEQGLGEIVRCRQGKLRGAKCQ
jgi:hypothetical protein